MSQSAKATLAVQGATITVVPHDGQDFISLTDIAKHKNPEHPDDVVRNWLRNRGTVEFLGIWERLNNPSFNPVEFDGIRIQTGLNSFVLTPKQWVEKTGATGIRSSAGRYGGTYAHKDIAFEFAAWVSVEFRLYLIKEFQRLKEEESQRLSLSWNLNRALSKINYRIHTDAIKAHLVPPEVTPAQAAITYANEADLLNVALFGRTSKQWREANPDLDGNMRDHATIEHLLVLANMESLNAEFIHMALSQDDRLRKHNAIAIRQIRTLADSSTGLLEGGKSQKP